MFWADLNPYICLMVHVGTGFISLSLLNIFVWILFRKGASGYKRVAWQNTDRQNFGNKWMGDNKMNVTQMLVHLPICL